MNGQWIGRYKGTQSGQIILNIDERPSFFEGVASIIDDDPRVPNALAFFKTKTKGRDFDGEAAILPVHPQTKNAVNWEAIRGLYPSATMSQRAEMRGTWTDNSLKISWKTDIHLIGEATLPHSKANAESQLVSAQKNWSDFKDYVAKLESGRFLFRKQNKP